MVAAERDRILTDVFADQLGRFYSASTLEKCDLLDYYCFSSRWASSVRAKVEGLLGVPARGGVSFRWPRPAGGRTP